MEAPKLNLSENINGQEIANNTNGLLSLNELTSEILSKITDKQIKEICRRENIRIKGTKQERIDRILKCKNYNVDIN